ncbi:Agamous-like MADS-box protein [Quillaja saponaria]|uniref:Agamous-like MADS-box protein n=1 Tax=Quillaja saponaria TaxID=32244 RepID=A0AAD7L8G7_QUISA|nr:Agamous-like MADS-box protein [Quillaja saponaria]
MAKEGQKKRMIQEADARKLAFQRRAGLFKKVRELCTLFAFRTALVIFSPSGEPYLFGQPSVEPGINRLSNPDMLEARASEEAEARQKVLHDRTKLYSDLLGKLGCEKKPGQDSELTFEEIQFLKIAVERLQEKLQKRLAILGQGSASTSVSSDANSARPSEGLY